jgi:hypothetical protein
VPKRDKDVLAGGGVREVFNLVGLVGCMLCHMGIVRWRGIYVGGSPVRMGWFLHLAGIGFIGGWVYG